MGLRSQRFMAAHAALAVEEMEARHEQELEALQKKADEDAAKEDKMDES